MNYAVYIANEIQKGNPNAVIEAERLYRSLSHKVPRRVYGKIVTQMVRDGILVRLAEGVYCRPRRSCTGGIVPLSEQEIISHYTKENRGLCIGYSLYRTKGLTTQVAKMTRVLSVATGEERVSVRSVLVEKLSQKLTPGLVRAIEVLEILQHREQVEDFNHQAFTGYMIDFARDYSEEDIRSALSVRSYNASTIASLKECLDRFDVPNHLEELLETCNAPEKIYEFA